MIPPLDTAARADGLLAGLFPPSLPRPGEAALMNILDDELRQTAPDFGRLASRWGKASDGCECPVVARAVRWLEQHGMPAPDEAFGPGLGAAVVTVGMAARLAHQPRNLYSGVYHAARLLDPSALGWFAALVAAATARCFLQARRDFVADVLDVLLSNDAPGDLVARLRQVPVWSRPSDAGEPVHEVVRELDQILRTLYHQGAPERARQEIERLSPSARRLGRGLLAARDGWPAVEGQPER